MSTGRQNKYDTHIKPSMDAISGWIRNGFTQQSIAGKVGVAWSTWKKHKAANEEFRKTVQEAEQNIVALAVNNLVKLMQGYSYDEEHTEVRVPAPQLQGAQAGQAAPQRMIIKKTITKHITPNLGAICLILFNRDPEKWKDKREIKHGGAIGHSGVLLTEKPLENTDEWKSYVKSLQAQQEPLNGNDKTRAVGERGSIGNQVSDARLPSQSQQ